MKPLVLIAYPLDTSFPRGYVLPRDTRVTLRAAERMAKAKRLTDAEMAAEVLMHERDHWHDMAFGGIHQYRYDRLLKIRDIARRPHYDEDTK